MRRVECRTADDHPRVESKCIVGVLSNHTFKELKEMNAVQQSRFLGDTREDVTPTFTDGELRGDFTGVSCRVSIESPADIST
ncbi:UBX domain-containing protein 2B [Frankliniella fusca]|uniref:UBX domain-containing protein 2B n=1 Tax=Frankliniella fusca TaxID=407009 RepID=A0AAE1L9W5_9NEOP|nr:UBX domain-containing protein 2B [Frankliniella fusca]